MDATSLDYSLLAAFVAVADETSFSKAATRLNVTKGTVSRAIQRLERIVGAKLLHRTTHAVALSTAGAALYERTAPHLRALRDALGTLPEREQEPAGLLRVTAPHDFGTILLPQLISQFSLRYPAVRFDLILTGAVVDLVSERIDLAIRASAGPMRDSSLTARKLGRTGFGIFAAPSYVARRGVPKEVGDAKHDWVIMPQLKKLVFGHLSDFEPRVVANDVLAVRSLIAEGLGVGALPGFVADPGLADGALVRVLVHDHGGQVPTFSIVYASSSALPRKVVAFRDFVIEQTKGRRLDPA